MCHNKFMKKLFLLLPILLLTGCQDMKVGFLNESHEAGLDHSISSSSNGKVDSYNFIQNMALDNTNLTKAVLTFNDIISSSSDIKDLEVINSFINIDQEVTVEAKGASYFSTKEEGYAFIGADSSYVDGYLAINFGVAIKNIEIKARPYSYIKTAFNEETLVIDHEVAICVNDLGYIKLNESANEEETKAVTSTCSFALNEASQEIVIKVGKRRAVIEEIDLYY